jgi:hypothetical protein
VLQRAGAAFGCAERARRRLAGAASKCVGERVLHSGAASVCCGGGWQVRGASAAASGCGERVRRACAAASVRGIRLRTCAAAAGGCGERVQLRAGAASGCCERVLLRAGAQLTKQSMEFFLALLVTASQSCGSHLLGVGLRFEEDEALYNACSGMGCVAVAHHYVSAFLGLHVPGTWGKGWVLTIDNGSREID